MHGAELSLRKFFLPSQTSFCFEAKHQVLLSFLRKLFLATSIQLGHHEVSLLARVFNRFTCKSSFSLGLLLKPLSQLSSELCILQQSFLRQSKGLDSHGLSLSLEVIWVEDEGAPVMVELSSEDLLRLVKLQVFLTVKDHDFLRADLLE